MKVVFAEPALEDLRSIRTYLKSHHPGTLKPFEQRLSARLLRIGMWPKTAYGVSERPGVRLVPLAYPGLFPLPRTARQRIHGLSSYQHGQEVEARNYPYKIYYTLTGNGAEILHVHHDKRQGMMEMPTITIRRKSLIDRVASLPEGLLDEVEESLDWIEQLRK
jgi:plasmid stabilization system protein ParE